MSKKILVAEDDQMLSNAYRLKLSRMGFDVKITSNGQEAIDALSEFPADLVILDLMMPIKDGFIALSEIKATEKLKSIPVIVASNLGQKAEIERCMSLGAADYIVKSDHALSEIVEKVKRLV